MLVKQNEFKGEKKTIYISFLLLWPVNPHGPRDEQGIFGGIGLSCIIMLLLLKVV